MQALTPYACPNCDDPMPMIPIGGAPGNKAFDGTRVSTMATEIRRGSKYRIRVVAQCAPDSRMI